MKVKTTLNSCRNVCNEFKNRDLILEALIFLAGGFFRRGLPTKGNYQDVENFEKVSLSFRNTIGSCRTINTSESENGKLKPP